MSEYKRYMHPTIELCRKCGGSGVYYIFHEHDLLNQHPIATQCSACEGSGRVLVSKITVTTVQPFKNK